MYPSTNTLPINHHTSDLPRLEMNRQTDASKFHDEAQTIAAALTYLNKNSTPQVQAKYIQAQPETPDHHMAI